MSATNRVLRNLELVIENPTMLIDGGFGREVRDALGQRRQWLIEQDLARVEQDKVVYRAGLTAELWRRELARTGAALERDVGVPYVEGRIGSRIETDHRTTGSNKLADGSIV